MKSIFLLVMLFFSINALSDDKPTQEEFINWIKTQSPEKLAKNSAEIAARKLPIQIDSMTVIAGVFAVGDTITMRIQALKSKTDIIALLKENGKTLKDYMLELRVMVQNMGCTQEINMAYIEQGVIYKYIVSDIKFKKLFEMSVTYCKT